MSVRPYRYYKKYIVLAGQTAGETYVVLQYAFRHLRQSEIYATKIKIWPKVEKWKARLHLNRDDVDHLALAVGIMRATDPKEESTHPDVVEEEKLKNAHQRVDKVMQDLKTLTPELLLLVEYHSTHKSSDASVFKQLRTAINKCHAVRRPVWGPWPPLIVAWHRDAIYLMNVLEAAAKRAGKQSSFTKEEAPAVQFISWALNRASASVARMLARYRKRFSDLSS